MRCFLLLVIAIGTSSGFFAAKLPRSINKAPSVPSGASFTTWECQRTGDGHGPRALPRTTLRMGVDGNKKSVVNPYYKGLDAYAILGVGKSAKKKAIKAAYRKLVSRWHPDKFPEDETKKIEGGLRMERINYAYFCLEDDDRRRRYDLYGEKGVGTSAASEGKLKTNADSMFGNDKDKNNNGQTPSSGEGSSSLQSKYRTSDDPFVWDKFRREAYEKREREQRKYDAQTEYNPIPQKKKTGDYNGYSWNDDWWKNDRRASDDGIPRRPGWGSAGFDDHEEDTAYDQSSDDMPFPNRDSTYEDIMKFLQKTGGLGGRGTSHDHSPPSQSRICDDDASIKSPRLEILRQKKIALLLEVVQLQRDLADDSTDWGEVQDASAISKRLRDMERISTIDLEISELDDEIEDTVMRARELNDKLSVFGGSSGFGFGSGDDAFDAFNPSAREGSRWATSTEQPKRANAPRGVTARKTNGTSVRRSAGGGVRPTRRSRSGSSSRKDGERAPKEGIVSGGGHVDKDLWREVPTADSYEEPEGDSDMFGDLTPGEEGEEKGNGADGRSKPSRAGAGQRGRGGGNTWRRSYEARRAGKETPDDRPVDLNDDEAWLDELGEATRKRPPRSHNSRR